MTSVFVISPFISYLLLLTSYIIHHTSSIFHHTSYSSMTME